MQRGGTMLHTSTAVEANAILYAASSLVTVKNPDISCHSFPSDPTLHF